jgi:hypothetical protein
MKKATPFLAALLLAGGALAASAATITFTGNASDFIGAGIAPLQADGIDTQTGFCGPDHPLDIDRLFVTNDGTNLYIGFDYARSCVCDINLGLALETKAGGTAFDPFLRQIDWSLEASAPDYYVYDVIPTNCNGFNYEVLYGANGSGGWNTIHDGANGLGAVDTDGGSFVELALHLADLGIDVANCETIRLEAFVTLEGGTRPGFDFVANDAEQNSTLAGTCFHVPPSGCAFVSRPTTYLSYVMDCPTPARKSTWGSLKSQYR